MTDKPPVPAAIWQRIIAFIREGRTGEVVLNVHSGTVQDATIKERIKDDRPLASASVRPSSTQ